MMVIHREEERQHRGGILETVEDLWATLIVPFQYLYRYRHSYSVVSVDSVLMISQ